MSRISVVLMGCLLLSQLSWGQRRGRPTGEFNSLFFEAVNLVADDSTKSRVDIQYRIDEDFFVATRNSSPSFPWEFKRRGDIVIELLDSLGVSKARAIDHAEMGTHDAEPGETMQWYQGIASLTVPPGLYKILIEMDDLESDRRNINRGSVMHAKKFDSDSAHSTPIFVEWIDPGVRADSLVCQNFGGNILYGNKSCLYVELNADAIKDTLISASYTISTALTPVQRPEVVITENHISPLVLRGYALETGPSAIYHLVSSAASKRLGVIVPIASEKLPLRNLTLDLSINHGTSVTKVSTHFHMVWPDMPLSLRDINYALESLRFITTEKQLDSLTHGNLEQRRDNLEAFWKARDKTPETAFNEVMTEYYHRVDYARKNFGTLKEPDGSRLDRGRIYVLYGPPTSTTRTLDPESGFREVWLYENHGKKFVFADENKSGNYILVSTQPL